MKKFTLDFAAGSGYNSCVMLRNVLYNNKLTNTKSGLKNGGRSGIFQPIRKLKYRRTFNHNSFYSIIDKKFLLT